MSGIVGVLNLSGKPLDAVILQRMMDAGVHRGPDGARVWIDGRVGLGHLMLHTTPESLHEIQPVRDESGDLCLVMDGRIDNGDELRPALESKGFYVRNDT